MGTWREETKVVGRAGGRAGITLTSLGGVLTDFFMS